MTENTIKFQPRKKQLFIFTAAELLKMKFDKNGKRIVPVIDISVKGKQP